jgi:hypothetical protein
MKTTKKLKKSIANLETAVDTIGTIEKEIKFALKSYYRDKIDGNKVFRLKTVYKFKQIALQVYLTVDNKAVIKNVVIFFSPTIIEDTIKQIDKQLNQ